MTFRVRLPSLDFEARLSSASLVPGPTISTASAYHYLKDEDWIEFGDMNVAQCRRDGVVPWFRGGYPEQNEPGLPFLAGPNTVFQDSSNRIKCRDVLNNPNIIGLSVLNDADFEAARRLADNRFRGRLFRLRHFLRAAVYERPFNPKPPERQLLIYIKGNINPAVITKYFSSSLILYYGFHTWETLLAAAETSRACLYVRNFESYGNAAQEIMACGCPIITTESAILKGNALEGRMLKYIGARGFQGADLDIQNSGREVIGSDLQELSRAIDECSGWNRREVYQASREFNDPKAIAALHKRELGSALADWKR